jgi:electron transport complex protein RnfD
MEYTSKERNLTISVSPHIKSAESVERIMWTVNLSLMPSFVAGIYYFGPRALFVMLLCVAGSIFSEWFVQKLAGKEITVRDGSAVLTGLLLGLNMPAAAPFYIPLVASFMAVGITKQLFGGLGYNVFNPALIGRAFALITWPRAMTTWLAPNAAFTAWPALDAKTMATPLGILKEEGMLKLLEHFGDKSNLYWQLFTGHRAGSIGETSVIAILLGAAYLVYRGYIKLHIPLTFIATVGLFAWIFGGKTGLFTGDPVVHMLSGGLMLGAFFMATDYVTCPTVTKGQIVFGVGCGLLTILIRLKAGYPEGVMFAILIMNCFTPLIDRNIRSKVFGKKEVKK